MQRGISHWITRRSLLNGGRAALVSDGEHITYADLDRRTNQVAAALLALGVRKGDRVAALLVNSAEFIQVLMGCAKIGAVTVPINVRLAGPEIGYILADSGADVLIFHDPLAAQATRAVTEPGVRVRHLVRAGGVPAPGEFGYGDLVSGAEPEPVDGDVDGRDPAFVMYTSGTTGRPKGAILTHDNLLWNAINVLGTDMGLRAEDVTVAVAPMFHIGGLGAHTLPLLYVGGTSVIMPSFDPRATLQAMADHRVTVQFMVPAMWTALTQVPDFDSFDLSALRFAMGGGSPVPLTVIDFMRERGVPFTEGFGMTETAPLVTILDADNITKRAGSIGRVAMHVDARIVDDDDRDVATDTVGELIVRGPNVFAGYWMKAEASAEAFRGGWFHTGDLGRMDAEGYITLVDRKKDMIISGGENVYPIEVEQVLFRHPALLDAAVIGGKDPKWGERVVAVVVADPATQAPCAEEIVAWCRERLAHFKCPRDVHFVAELPRNATGKLLKTALREQFTGIKGGVVLR
ncbi:long-chain fatty acid--CoA ligase [Candidatus Mycobacterium wuenschmannii]|uniref:Long-chain fatty acid--CoA ligase n=1 Tax=Candidatus Mycobacterium wuenschmannii TaxID=3027808 RepID=A0ABY8VSJ1_9MYCO|nr:long-chain fatty acid--CoA ligase [Candidatus Mycobacterium wuenschmannii]WIM85911.1 long-chain fatty acid--CoA ligase [Candidatus Mycobacterium wuenschmannii]